MARSSPAATAAATLLLCLCTALALQQDEPAITSMRPGGRINGRNPSTADVVVHLFEWSWEDVGKECESFLGPAGYKAVQVSPPQEDTGGNAWWTRYQPVSYRLESRSGTRQQFADMVQRCTAAGVDVIVDVVLNHMAGTRGGSGRGRNGSSYGPGCRSFPGLYSCNDFHTQGDCCHNCQMYTDTDLFNLQFCDIGLPDLDTASAWVQQKQAEYLRDLADLNVAGVRIDAAKHMPDADLRSVLGRSGRQLYVNLEIIIQPWAPCALNIEHYHDIGRVWEFKYPRLISDAFKNRQLDLLFKMGSYADTQWALPERAMSFVVNHDRLVHGSDRPFTVTHFDGDLYPLALVFLLAHPYGQPNVLSSINFSLQDLDKQSGDYNGAPVDPAGRLLPVHNSDGSVNCGAGKPYLCEHRWPQVAAMVQWRQAASGPDSNNDVALWDVLNNNAAVSFARGKAGEHSRAYVSINTAWQEGQDVRQKVRTGLPPGTYCNILKADSCQSTVTVGADGTAEIYVPLLSAMALHVHATAPSHSS